MIRKPWEFYSGLSGPKPCATQTDATGDRRTDSELTAKRKFSVADTSEAGGSDSSSHRRQSDMCDLLTCQRCVERFHSDVDVVTG